MTGFILAACALLGGTFAALLTALAVTSLLLAAVTVISTVVRAVRAAPVTPEQARDLIGQTVITAAPGQPRREARVESVNTNGLVAVRHWSLVAPYAHRLLTYLRPHHIEGPALTAVARPALNRFILQVLDADPATILEGARIEADPDAFPSLTDDQVAATLAERVQALKDVPELDNCGCGYLPELTPLRPAPELAEETAA